jgi:hypothetical protein
MSECAGISSPRSIREHRRPRGLSIKKRRTSVKSAQNTTTVKIFKSTEVRSKLEFIIGTLREGALQWREDYV